MGILGSEAIHKGLEIDQSNSGLGEKLTACERKAYAKFLTLSSEERQDIANKVKTGSEVDENLLLGYKAYTKVFNT